MSLDIEEQYDKIYRYCYFKLHNREVAEDITQETFLRYLKNYNCITTASALKCLYTIARNLCIDEYRKPKFETIDESILDKASEDNMLMNITVRMILNKFSTEEQELLLLRYVNEVPISVLAEIYGISRFAVYRKLTSATNKFREELQKEDYYG
ncbi:MAG: RNA polymerase sigma factor [Erysipelotrichales bacterium]|nr:RNA polymerase sigma factor [Erysipelotrichales bacterium]